MIGLGYAALSLLLVAAQQQPPASPPTRSPAPASTPTPSTTAAPQTSTSGDILVRGDRLAEDSGIASTSQTMNTIAGEWQGSLRQVEVGGVPTFRRIRYEASRTWARCALRTRRWKDIRSVVDGVVNSPRQAFDQGRLIQRTASCYEQPTVIGAGDVQTVGSWAFDRVALVEEILASYAPGFSVTAEQIADPKFSQRFNRREAPRNAKRFPTDDFMFAVGVCLVRFSPDDARRLLDTKISSSEEIAVASEMVDRGRVCIGNAKKVAFDSVALRIYVADVLYRWAVAVNGVESLVPSPA